MIKNARMHWTVKLLLRRWRGGGYKVLLSLVLLCGILGGCQSGPEPRELNSMERRVLSPLDGGPHTFQWRDYSPAGASASRYRGKSLTVPGASVTFFKHATRPNFVATDHEGLREGRLGKYTVRWRVSTKEHAYYKSCYFPTGDGATSIWAFLSAKSAEDLEKVTAEFGRLKLLN